MEKAMTKYNDVPFVPCNDCSNFESCQEEAYQQGRADVIKEIIALCDDYRASGHNLDVEKYLREQLKEQEQ